MGDAARDLFCMSSDHINGDRPNIDHPDHTRKPISRCKLRRICSILHTLAPDSLGMRSTSSIISESGYPCQVYAKPIVLRRPLADVGPYDFSVILSFVVSHAGTDLTGAKAVDNLSSNHPLDSNTSISTDNNNSMIRKSVGRMTSTLSDLVGATGCRYQFKELIQERPHLGRVWCATSETLHHSHYLTRELTLNRSDLDKINMS